MSKGKKIIVGNWKMNPESSLVAKKIIKGLSKGSNFPKSTTVVICPPALFLSGLKKDYRGSKIKFGAQNVHFERSGAYTGEISALMLKDAGASYAIVGHSERRSIGETNQDVALKVKSVLSVGICPIICIGEKDRDVEGFYLANLSTQLHESLSEVSKKDLSKITIAYEPVWAIGEKSKGAMESRDIHETVLYLRKILADMFGKKEAMDAYIIYGGSVDEKNAGDIIKEGDVCGFLVGRASLEPKKFSGIINASS